MPLALRSFGKINIGLCIGPRRADAFHELRTLYQTIELHDVVRLEIVRGGTGVEIRCNDPRVPDDESNTCWRMAERVMRALKARGRVRVGIEKKMPVQGGLGASSSNAAAVMLGLEQLLKTQLAPPDKLRIAAEVGSDVPLFLVGGLVLGVGRGEQVYPMPDLPAFACVAATPAIGVSTPEAFAAWDRLAGKSAAASDTMKEFSQSVFAWLGDGFFQPPARTTGRRPASGVPARGRDRAEALLLGLVRTGIENDFERVVFPEHPELRDLKHVLWGEHGGGARYASLSGSGSTVYGLFGSAAEAGKMAAAIARNGTPAQVTATLPRQEYWGKFLVSRS